MAIITFFSGHSDDQSWLSNRYDTWQATTQADDIRHNASDVSHKLTNMMFNTYWTITDLFGKVVSYYWGRLELFR